MKARGKFTILVAVLLVATLLLFLISFQVRMSETAIVYTFRKATRYVDEPGFYFKLPYPIQTVTKYSKRTNIHEGRFQEYITKDQHTLIVNIAVGWTIATPERFEEAVGTHAKAEEKLAALVGGAANAIINSHPLADFVSVGNQKQSANVEAEIHEAVKKEAQAQYGIHVPLLWITQLGLPEDVTPAVFDLTREERRGKAEALRADGNRKAETIKAEADLQASDIRAKAEAEALVIRGEGDKLAAKHYGIFSQDPELANFLTSLKAIRKLKERTTYILTPDTPPYHLLKPDLQVPGAEPPPGEKPKASEK